MPIGTVLFFVVIAAGVGLMAFFFTRGAGPDWMWRGGRNDPVRNMLFRADGSWRRYGKLGVLLFWLAILGVTYLARNANAV